MFKTAAIPYILTLALYMILSVRNPLHLGENGISGEIAGAFNLNIAVILPAVIILVLAVFRVDVKLSMLVSIGCRAVIAVLIQQVTIAVLGGGIISMLKACLIILVAFALSAAARPLR